MPVTREYALSYGSFILGTSTGTMLHGPVRISKTRRRVEVRFTVVLAGTSTAADYATKALAFEAAFRLPRETFSLVLSSQNRLVLTEGSNAFDIETEWVKPGGGGDSGRSALYEVKVSANLPEPLSALAGRAEFEWTVVYDASCVGKLTTKGTYLRTGSGTGSRAAYEAGYSTRLGAITTLLGGTWRQVRRSETTDEWDNETKFQREHEEQTPDSVVAGIDLTDLAEIRCEVSRILEAPGDDPGSGATRLKRLRGTWSASLCHTSDRTLDEIVNEVAIPSFLSRARDVGGSTVAVTQVEVAPFDYERSRVQVNFSAVASGASSVVESKTTTRDRLETRTAILDTWEKVGDVESYTPGAAYVLGSPCRIVRTITVRELVIGDADIPGGSPFAGRGVAGIDVGIGARLSLDFPPSGVFGIGAGLSLNFSPPPEGGVPNQGAGGGSAALVAPGADGWVLLEKAPEWASEKLGLDAYGTPIVLTERVNSSTWRKVTGAALPRGGSGSSSGGTRERGKPKEDVNSAVPRARPGGPA